MQNIALTFEQLQWVCAGIGGIAFLFFLLFISKARQLSKSRITQNEQAQALSELTKQSHQLEQDLMQQTMRGDNLSENLIEKNERLERLEKQEESITSELVHLKERNASSRVWVENQQKHITQQGNELSNKNKEIQQLNQNISKLEQELIEINTILQQKTESFEQQIRNFDESKKQLSIEFQNLANRIFEEKSKNFTENNQLSMDSVLKPFREQIEGFQKRVNEVHSESLKGNAHLENELKKVLDIGLHMSKEANNLTSALKGNKKVLGNWGEMQLERSLQLAGLIEGDHYSAQESFQSDDNRRRQPDFIIKLPDDKHLIIDSKVSLVDFERAVSSDDDIVRRQALNDHIKALRNHVNDLSGKDYSNLIGMRSPNFVLMFVPVEPAFMEAMRLDNNLFNEAYNKNVVIVSHTTLMPILRTVANLWRLERGNSEAREISAKAGELYNQVCLVAERFAKVGNSLNALTNNYNNALKAVSGNQGLYGKVERFRTLSSKATKLLPELNSLHNNIDESPLTLTAEPYAELKIEGNE